MKYPKEDVPGDAVASARAVTEYWYEVGRALGDVDKYQKLGHVAQPELYDLRVKCDLSDEQGFLVIAKGFTEKGYVIAFHRGETVVEAVVGMSRRLKNHTLKWKEDTYANDK